ncbi:MAG: amylo-alpha-1,6-glucosidase [Bacteroidetes bacterium]|nr:MAG: amylo-alpha-1,6-glucosidase [Bacteroidota bacterium]
MISVTPIKIITSFALLLFGQQMVAQRNIYAQEIMAGISNIGRTNSNAYLTPGDRSYIVGTQDGNFPDLGSHVTGEMGGLWMPPVKLLDGFWVKLSDATGRRETWLKEAREFINYPYGNKFVYPSIDDIEVERLQYCPRQTEGAVIQFKFKNTSTQPRDCRFSFVVKTDLSPVWFSKENNITDAPDSIHWVEDKNLFIANDTKHPWFVVWGSSLPAISHDADAVAPVQTRGLGKAASTTYRLQLKPHETVTAVFVVSGSDKDLVTAQNNYEMVLKNHNQLLEEKEQQSVAIINRARVVIPDKKFEQAYTWGKLNTEWLVSELPGIGRFLGAGAVEYPWLFGCDNTYAVQGVVVSGDPDLAQSTLRTLKRVSEKENGNGRIIHEMSSNGFVYNKGNVQETPHFAVAVWKVFNWTGDTLFLKEMYPYIKKGLNWLLTEEDKDKNMFPEGNGIMEVKGLDAELIDVAVYTRQALEAASKMAAILDEPERQKEYTTKASVLKNKINTQFWDESEGSFCDFYGTREQALSVAQGAIEQLKIGHSNKTDSGHIAELQHYYEKLIQHISGFPAGTEKGWFTNKNWVISTPLEMQLAPPDKAVRLLNKVRLEHCGEYGPYLSAVERRHMMTISTGVQALAECAYGRTDEAMWYVNKIVQTFNRALPGSISEMMPDYGCPVQAWTIYGLASPLVTYFLGINPDAYNKSVVLSPHLPQGWNNAAIYDLPVGNNMISFDIKKHDGNVTYYLTSVDCDWAFKLVIKGLAGKRYVLNGKVISATTDEIELKGKTNKVTVLL